jgi:hypothetical protein
VEGPGHPVRLIQKTRAELSYRMDTILGTARKADEAVNEQ